MRLPITKILLVNTISFLFIFHLLYAESLGNYTSHEFKGQRLIIYAGTPAVVISPYSDKIVQVSLFPQGTIEPESSFIVVLEPESVSWNLMEEDSTLTMALGNWSIHVQKYPVRISFSKGGDEFLSDEDGFFWDSESKGVRFSAKFGENFYGAGERAVNINRRGMWLESYNSPWFGYSYGAENLNITIPFLFSLFFECKHPMVICTKLKIV